MKKIISAAMAVTLCVGAVASCGKKDSGGSLSTSGKSKYTAILPLDGSRAALMDGIDSGIKYSINKAKDYEKENKNAKYNPWVIEFSDGKFVMPISMGNGDWTYYDGKFSVKNAAIKFSYENFINGDTKINVKDKAEYDEDIIKRKSEKLDGLSAEEKKEIIAKEQEKFTIAATAEQMQKLNKTGAYCKHALPLMNFSDMWVDFSVLPYIRYARGGGNITYINTESTNTLKTVGDFLCTDTYGINLKGSYKKGKDFKLEHNLIDTIKKDEQSFYQGSSEKDERWERNIESAERYYGCDDLKSTINFSDGEWEWYNADNDLLNNGKYEESKDYPGLIKMYVDEDSEKCPDYAESCPLWFYIDDDGEIYYPAFVKVE